jgi:hypothetical protein
MAGMTGWNTIWHATKPFLLTLGGFAFLILTVRGMLRGETAAKVGGKIYYEETPLGFWFVAILNLMLGVSLVLSGVASFKAG